MRNKMPQHTRTKGQALVEFALASTLIFFMLAAVVDLGLIFFTLQGLHNAAQEGATYGSRWLVTSGNTTTLDYAAIRDRVRHEAGNQGIGFANLLDLNSNGKDDVVFNEQSNGKPLIQDYIQVAALKDANGNDDPLDDNDTPCPNVSSSDAGCFIRIIVSADYNMAFPLAPAFGDKIKLNSTYVMPMRSGFSQGGAPTITPVVVTVTPTP
jgi:Flp pilus assembly protein TadG